MSTNDNKSSNCIYNNNNTKSDNSNNVNSTRDNNNTAIINRNKPTKCTKKSFATAELMATAVHDLKNPLASIRGLGQLGMMTASTKKEYGYFERIIRQVDKMNSAVSDLVDIFKPESPLLACPTSIVRSILYEIQPLCEMHGIKLALSSSFEGRVSLRTKIFKRVIENLINNSVHVLTEGGKIDISIYQENNNVHISITDNGPGIPEEIRDNLFQPFTYHRKDGTGLGLFMVYYSITEMHDGQIWYESTMGKGTTFHIQLPV